LTLVIDANVVVKWFVDEDGSDEARALLTPDEPLIAPAHILGEVGEALLRSYRRGVTPRDQLDAAQIILVGAFQIISLDEILSRSIAISLSAGLSVYDSFYVAAAELHGTQLVTDDRVLLRKLAGTEWANLARPLVPLN
jgi:predicted nucleic acid-binding protein